MRRPTSSNATWREGRIGLKTGKGFLDYESLDLEAYRRERLRLSSRCSATSA